MQRLVKLILPIAAIAAMAVPAAAATPVSVPGDAGWVATGITVTVGQTVSIQTLGNVQTAPIPQFHVPGDFKSSSGPAGQTTNPTCGETTATFSKQLLAETGPCALDSANFGELIGRVGRKTFAIGDATSFTAPASGELQLAANDLAAHLLRQQRRVHRRVPVALRRSSPVLAGPRRRAHLLRARRRRAGRWNESRWASPIPGSPGRPSRPGDSAFHAKSSAHNRLPEDACHVAAKVLSDGQQSWGRGRMSGPAAAAAAL